MPDISEYSDNVRKYSPKASDVVIAGVVKHLGIALRSKNASLVACTDASELERVREKFLKKKLQLDLSDEALDEAVQAICQQMKRAQ
ncbi:MAG: DUF2853 family protein [Deinococcales bacterium]